MNIRDMIAEHPELTPFDAARILVKKVDPATQEWAGALVDLIEMVEQKASQQATWLEAQMGRLSRATEDRLVAVENRITPLEPARVDPNAASVPDEVDAKPKSRSKAPPAPDTKKEGT